MDKGAFDDHAKLRCFAIDKEKQKMGEDFKEFHHYLCNDKLISTDIHKKEVKGPRKTKSNNQNHLI